MRTASIRSLNPLRLFSRSQPYDQLPGYDRSNAASLNPPPYKQGRFFSFHGLTQRLRFFRSPVRLLITTVVAVIVIILLTTTGYHDRHHGGDVVYSDGGRDGNSPEDAWKKEEKERAQGTQHIWEEFPR